MADREVSLADSTLYIGEIPFISIDLNTGI